jgi:hypothetical protein
VGSFGSHECIYSRLGFRSLPYLRLRKRVVHQQPIGSIAGPTLASSFVSTQEVLYISASSLSNKQESELDGNHLIVPCTLSNHELRIATHALIDYGYTGVSFMNGEFARQHNFPHYQLKTPKTIKVIDGRPISSGDITEYIDMYYDYLKIFGKANADKLPPNHPSDQTILLTDSFKPLFGPLYLLSHPKLEELKHWSDENLSKGFIHTSSFPTAAPISLVKNGDGSLRLVIDYRGINEGTIKNQYPLPLLQDTVVNVSKAKCFMKLDISGAYNLIHIAKGEE